MTEGLHNALLISLAVLLAILIGHGRYRHYPAFCSYVALALIGMCGGFSQLRWGPWTVVEWGLMLTRAGAAVECLVHLANGLWWRKDRRKIVAALISVPVFGMLLWPVHGFTEGLRHFQTLMALFLLLTIRVLRFVPTDRETRYHAWLLFAVTVNQAMDLWTWQWWPQVGRDAVLSLNYAGAALCALGWVVLIVRPRVLHRVSA